MTLLAPLNDSPDESMPPALSTGAGLATPAEDLPPLTVTTDACVPAVEATGLRLRDAAAVRDAVGRFAAATLLPATSPPQARDRVRDSWAAAVDLIEVASHPEWMLAFIPGSHVGDALVHAIHLNTGHVFGGDSGPTVQQPGESTHVWLDRLTADFETHAADYSMAYVAYPDHA